MRWVWRFAIGGAGLMTGLAVWAQTAESVPMNASSVTDSPRAGTASAMEKRETPLVFYTGDGQFEIIAVQTRAAQQTLTLANSVWRALAPPLKLPAEGFSSAVAVRLVPEKEWTGVAVFSVVAEVGGRVGVRIKWSENVDARIVRRALVQALILRQAVAWYGASSQLTVPLWLELACTSLSETRDRPAMLDAMQQESAQLSPPSIEGLLRWERGQAESRGWELSAFWLLQHLQAEASDARRWEGWLRAIVGGTDPLRALQDTYGLVLKDGPTRELWWQVGFYNKRTPSMLPLMSTEETRNWLADRCRWLAVRQGQEQVLALDDLWAARKEPWVKTGLTERSQQLQNQLARLHPFYLNAAISMGWMYQAAIKGDESAFKAAQAALTQDAVDGRELENATSAALDKLEKR